MRALFCRPVGLLAATIALVVAPPAGAADCSAERWVTSWAASPSHGRPAPAGPVATGPATGGGRTYRLVITPHLRGTTVRVRLSNRFGSGPVTFAAATIAQRRRGASLKPGTIRSLRFGGRPAVTVPAGRDVVSDAAGLAFSAFDDLAVSVHVAGPVARITEHFVAQQLSYSALPGAGDRTRDTSALRFGAQLTARPFVTGLEVRAPGQAGAIAALGDSLTDGYSGPGATAGAGTGRAAARWPDALRRRLIAAGRPLAVVNAGVSGNRILRDGDDPVTPLSAAYGPAARDRLRADVLAQSGVTGVIVLEGINDIGMPPQAGAAEVIGGLTGLVEQVRAAGLPVWLATLTPIDGSVFDSPAAQTTRTAVNAWIRSQRIGAGVVDTDAAVRDPAAPGRLLPAFDSGDHLHLSPAGYRALAAAVDLAQLPLATCAAAPPVASRLQLSVSVSPSPAPAGTLATFRIRVRAVTRGRAAPVAGALVRMAGRRGRTDATGTVTLRVRVPRTGTLRVLATDRGHRPGRTVVRVPASRAR
ncbi:GDSL-type esterase/lipase family protein [Paraconexibacter sp. AEG42_29]|uniref:GDSL-type esterase/lipase family protein n=1 Tax=Paraconexibacter sp. AEG42_29 TaxID=2997339 RepID=UPI00339D71E9